VTTLPLWSSLWHTLWSMVPYMVHSMVSSMVHSIVSSMVKSMVLYPLWYPLWSTLWYFYGTSMILRPSLTVRYGILGFFSGFSHKWSNVRFLSVTGFSLLRFSLVFNFGFPLNFTQGFILQGLIYCIVSLFSFYVAFSILVRIRISARSIMYNVDLAIL
jgi:hypothetical protein